MKRLKVLAAALAATLALAAAGTCAHAQRQAYPQGENLPEPGNMTAPGNADSYAGEFATDGWSPAPGPASCNSGYCGECGDYGCCNGGGFADCEYGCAPSCDSSWWDCCGLTGGRSSWFFTADYLYVRASFSEAVAYVEEDIDSLDNQSDFRHELNFQHESSYRFGGGCRLNCCDEELRFLFTRFRSGAAAIAPQGTFVPYEVFSPDEPTFINAGVDVKSFDLDYRKTIPLGGPQCCGCGDCCDPCGGSCDPCGCGDACCAPACPAWDITWSGGVRIADVDWNRNYFAYVDSDVFRSAVSTMDFTGAGPRVGLEGRRYFGMKHWCSIYLKGDISLLLGQMQQQVVRVDEDGLVTTLTDRGRRIIPVTEIEAGGSLCLTRSSMLSAGYLFSAWHDLGFRDQFATETLVESNTTDTANILGFDGLFIRLEFAY